MNYIQITITTADTQLQELFIALMTDLGYEGFEQEDTGMRGYIPELQFDESAVKDLLQPFGVGFVADRIEEKNWNEEWEKNFQPVVVDDFCAIRAHFHAPIKGVMHELVITPKMSFGTGHHATTFMMIQRMQSLDFTGKRVFDFGTGTGVLAILAEKLGGGVVVAIDNDDWSIENAKENVSTNGCEKISVIKSDQVPVSDREGSFDVILANINKHVILSQLPALGQQLKEGGVILLSGLLIEDAEDVENEAVKNNLSVSDWITKGNWICGLAEKRSN